VGGSIKPLADVVVDSVVALEGRRVKCRFYELEIELAGGTDTDLRRIEKALREAGAQDGDPRPKVFRVLGLGLPVSIDPLPSSSPPIEHVMDSMRTQVKLILAHDPGTRLGSDPEELHKMRVATRRLRAYLRAARPLLVPDWAEPIRAEVGWLCRTLGPVRDLDVMLGHLGHECGALRAPERRACEGLLDLLRQQQQGVRGELMKVLDSERYLALLARLETGVLSPAAGNASASLRDMAGAEFKKLRRAIKAGGLKVSDAVLHQYRIKGKRARYAAELALTSVGKPAARFLRHAKVFQDLLGEHHDAWVTEQRLRKLLRQAHSRLAAFSLGRLIERQCERCRKVRSELPTAWTRLKKQGQKAWA
jgi:CHAD domain-containing protein